MSDNKVSKYHRLGEPGGPGCGVGILDIEFPSANGKVKAGELLDGGKNASELELLRTVAARLGVKWGNDDLGWWAIAEKSKINTWSIWRQDDNGNRFLIERDLTEEAARNLADKMEATGHKQTYWVTDNGQ